MAIQNDNPLGEIPVDATPTPRRRAARAVKPPVESPEETTEVRTIERIVERVNMEPDAPKFYVQIEMKRNDGDYGSASYTLGASGVTAENLQSVLADADVALNEFSRAFSRKIDRLAQDGKEFVRAWKYDENPRPYSDVIEESIHELAEQESPTVVPVDSTLPVDTDRRQQQEVLSTMENRRLGSENPSGVSEYEDVIEQDGSAEDVEGPSEYETTYVDEDPEEREAKGYITPAMLDVNNEGPTSKASAPLKGFRA